MGEVQPKPAMADSLAGHEVHDVTIGRLLREVAARSPDTEALVEHSYRFHRAIIEASGNQLLLNVWQGLHIEMRTTLTMMAPGIDLMAAADSHQPIVDAILSGDVELACRVTREHQQYFERLPPPEQGSEPGWEAARSG